MFLFNQQSLIQVLLQSNTGVDIVSYGRPRDGFELNANIPFFTSGFGGKYEITHTNVPAGVMIAVGNLDSVDVTDFDTMKTQLANIDIYPAGHSGDFTEVKPEVSQNWFKEHSRLDNAVNNQVPLAHAKQISPQYLGSKYNELVDYLADNMHIFKNSNKGGELTPTDKSERAKIVIDILDGLSKTVRYTRLDDPAKAFQISAEVIISKEAEGKGEIFIGLVAEDKILVLRQHKNKQYDITPLDRRMMGQTYVTADGEPLGKRGEIDLGEIMTKAEELEKPAKPDFIENIIKGGRSTAKASVA